ncbi:hypothetical protein AB4Y42_43585 [Paraburkholderia sp. EG286B]|uniref:hypothetical protein n=1 Tax=Paraburkholderia sp. EG286B TaxID=3237011 RepID=UPI0034D1A4C5
MGEADGLRHVNGPKIDETTFTPYSDVAIRFGSAALVPVLPRVAPADANDDLAGTW